MMGGVVKNKLPLVVLFYGRIRAVCWHNRLGGNGVLVHGVWRHRRRRHGSPG
jgi:hypothetical protein